MVIFKKIACVMMLLVIFTGCGAVQNGVALLEDAEDDTSL